MSSANEQADTHWDSVASSWNVYSSPARPCGEDLAAYLRFATTYSDTPPDATKAVLMLGVTPEIATMAWPAGTVVTGVDKSEGMVNGVWPGDIPGVRHAWCDDWFALRQPERPYDLVIGDGSINMLRYPGELRRLLEKLRSLARPGALVILRSFVRPTMPESVAALVEAAQDGGIASFYAFKFRLTMALQSSPEEGVPLDEVWQAWRRLDPVAEQLSKKNGWRPEAIRPIELSRGKQGRLSFPALDELVAALECEGISVLDCHVPKYEMGDRCPILVGRI